eukprot:6994553-Prymnesium_polylepis.1
MSISASGADSAAVTIAGSGNAMTVAGTGAGASFNRPFGIDITSDGAYAIVTEGHGHTVRAVQLSDGAVTTLAGSTVAATTDGVGAAASFNWPLAVSISHDGATVYIAVTGSHTVRAIAVPTFRSPGSTAVGSRGTTHERGVLLLVFETFELRFAFGDGRAFGSVPVGLNAEHKSRRKSTAYAIRTIRDTAILLQSTWVATTYVGTPSVCGWGLDTCRDRDRDHDRPLGLAWRRWRQPPVSFEL